MNTFKNENVPFGYFALNNNGQIKDANVTFLSWLGYRLDEMVNKNIEDFLSVSSKMIFHSFFFLQLQLSNKVDEISLTIKSKNGYDVPFMLMGYQPEVDSKNHIACIAIKMSKRYDYEKELRDIKIELERAYESKKISLLKESEVSALLESTLNSIVEGIIVVNLEKEITMINNRAQILTGYSSSEALNKPIKDVLVIVDEKTNRSLLDLFLQNIGQDFSLQSPKDAILIAKDQTRHFISGSATTIFNDNKEIMGAVIAFIDITKEYIQEKEIEAFLNVNLDMLSVSDLNANFHKVNKKFKDVLGYSSKELEGQSYLSFIHPDDVEDTKIALDDLASSDSVKEFINRYKAKDGSYKYIEWQSQKGASTYIYSSARDVTSKVLAEENLKTLSFTDQLTGLYNRQFLNSIIHDEIVRSDMYNLDFSMALVDLDDFKLVNDTYGHPVGDKLLQLTATTILENKRSTDLVFRFGGEEFLILMPGCNIKGAQVFLEKLRKAIENINYHITGVQTVSIGATQRLKNEDFDQWYKKTDKALYQAKNLNKNCVVLGD